ncbi:MAG: hypothetical protein ABI402_09930 [Ferruginibacter sp.]
MKLIFLMVFLGIQSICPMSGNKKCCNKTADRIELADSPLNFGCIYLMKY